VSRLKKQSQARQQRVHRRKEERRLRRLDVLRARKRQVEPPLARARSRRQGEKNLRVPRYFSFLRDPESTSRFLGEFAQKLRRYHVKLDFRKVEVIGPEAIAAMTAVLKSRKRPQFSRVRGNDPLSADARMVLEKSGFFELVRHSKPLERAATGKIQTRGSDQVDGKLAQDLIHFGMECLTGVPARSQPVYETLIECMTNTRHHAGGESNQVEGWWATVYADEERRRVCFTFVDMGVGILATARKNFFIEITEKLGLRDDKDLLRGLLSGEIGSRTELKGRGRGLPKICNWSKAGRIQSLLIVTNFVYANVELAEYRLMPEEFDGTLLYWEIEP